MCGIAGIIYKNKHAEKEDILKMLSVQKHRGPDGSNYFIKDNVAIGHNRLAIIDIELGIQPMCDIDLNIYITFNGEIYNFRNLKNQLISLGYKFKTKSDTEVIIVAYKHWGIEAFNKLRGMFAFSIIDFKKKRMYIVRDMHGIKPLIYYENDDFFIFASEINTIKAIVSDKLEISYKSIDYYLRLDFVPAPDTIYNNMFKLFQGSYLEIDFNGNSCAPKKYWELIHYKSNDNSFNHKEDSTDIIKESVHAHLVSDVPFGILLSGGIDSTVIALEMRELLKNEIKAFCIGFNDKDANELDYAKKASKVLGLDLEFDIVDIEKCHQILPNLISHYGEPFCDNSIIPTWYLAKLARSSVPMVLSGDGGDEFFGGYDHYKKWLRTSIMSQIKKLVKFESRPSFRLIVNDIINIIIYGSENNISSYYNRITNANKKVRKRLWKDKYPPTYEEPIRIFHELSEKYHLCSRLAYAQSIDINTYLPSNILNKVDMASMYHGLEVRTPFVDKNIAKLFLGLPDKSKIRNNKNGNLITKIFLKEILTKKFGRDFINRPKKGFSIPFNKWMKHKNQLGNYVKDSIFSNTSNLHLLFNKTELAKEYNQFINNDNNARLIWNLMVLNLWLENN